jgi:hypothetical protein
MLKKFFLACAVVLCFASTASGAVVAYVLQTPGVV